MSVSGVQTQANCSGNHKSRLIVGDGNFSFAQEIIRKHDQKVGHTPDKSLAHAIVATELKSEIRCSECDLLDMFADLAVSSPQATSSEATPTTPALCDACTIVAQRVDTLKSQGAQIQLSVDGTKLHEAFPNRTFSRVHWNCPHDGSNFKDQTLPPIIREFFKSCKQVQADNDRVHITLAQPAGKTDFYQGYIYDIVLAASASGYKLIKKRAFSTTRYPGYTHVQTNRGAKASVTDEGMREFVFEKINPDSFKQIAEDSKTEDGRITILNLSRKIAEGSDKNYLIQSKTFYDQGRAYYGCSTDDDSSDYES